MAISVENLHQRRPFVIGWDMACYDVVPGKRHCAEIHRGWSAARERVVNRKQPDRYVLKWLQLRNGAFERGKQFDANVTPDYLRSIDVTHCPILEERLTHSKKDSRLNWSIDRVDNRRGYERGNLAVMSTYANQIKSDMDFEAVLRKEISGPLVGLLNRVHWERMYDLMSQFYRTENIDIADLEFFYRGQTLVPNAPMNWVMEFQLYWSWCINSRHRSPFIHWAKCLSKSTNQKQEFSKLLKRTLKMRREPVHDMHLNIWANCRNLEELSRWLQWMRQIQPAAYRYLRNHFGRNGPTGSERFRNHHLLKWLQTHRSIC